MDVSQIHDLFDCSVCFERLNETCKVLPCQHTFCKSCLRAIVASKQELRCPECRSLVTEDIDKLPGNITLIRLLEGLKIAQTNETRPLNPKVPIDEPCARAVYSYDAREPGDLNLKRGDLIILIQKVDDNWFIGDLSGKQGYLPANFVEVINPLPKFNEADKPLARGMYDFEDEEEEDLLQFKQGEIITVLRRVDLNWCEGKIGDRCGIFPLNFVQLNKSATELVKLTRSPQPIQQTRRKPNAPLNALRSRLSQKRTQAQRPIRRARSIPRDNPESMRRRLRDFSNTDVIASQGGVSANRHSIEVFSTERSNGLNSSDDDSVMLPLRTADASIRKRCSNNPVETQEENQSSSRGSSPTQQARNIQDPSNLYIAVYNYRPQRFDELELCAGEHYKVVEQGDDGWYKGFAALRRQNVGYFPGNYVRSISVETSSISDVPLFQRRRNRPLSTGRDELVLPRPRPCSDISTESNPDSEFSPPLTPPLVAAKPPKHGLLRRLSIGKKKDRINAQSTQTTRANIEQSDGATTVLRASKTAQQRAKTDGRQSGRSHTANKEKYRVTANYPPHNPLELELKRGDIVYVTRKKDDGWYHGTLEKNGKVGFFPRNFVERI